MLILVKEVSVLLDADVEESDGCSSDSEDDGDYTLQTRQLKSPLFIHTCASCSLFTLPETLV